MKTSHLPSLLSIGLALCLFAPFANAQIVNGGFETGTATTAPPWVYSDPSNFTGFGSNTSFAHSGTRYAFLGATGTNGTMSQTFNTVAGAIYSISFFLANDGTTPPNLFQAMFNGIQFVSLTNVGRFGYTQFTGTGFATAATSTLTFTYRNDADFFRLDDVSVNRVSAVPESSLGLVGLATLGLLCVVHYRGTAARRSAAVAIG